MKHQKEPCPSCGQPKTVGYPHCRRCAGRLRRTAQHGTASRYRRHLADGEPACEPCKRAHAAEVAKDDRRQAAARRRARQQQRAAASRCPDCGATKSPAAKRCKPCADKHRTGRPVSATHGTDSGYFRHIRIADAATGWPRTACDDCRRAHAEAEAERQKRRPAPRPRKRVAKAPSRRRCRDCNKPISEHARRCRSCAQRHNASTKHRDDETPIRWVRVGPIWKAA